MNVIGIIPARMGSSRFPGKPLAPILGMPMIGHVFHRSRLSARLNRVYLATCDREIADYGRSIGADVVMTADTHQRASDRTAEAADVIERETGRPIHIVVMIQGDEPMIAPEMVDAAVDALVSDDRAAVVNLMGRVGDREGLEDPNEIKVVVDRENFALYFSRSPVPFVRDAGRWSGRNQICVVPFRRAALIEFNALPATPLEVAESIDMLRLLEHGRRVKMVPVDAETCSVDTPDDLAAVEARMAADPLVQQYASVRR